MSRSQSGAAVRTFVRRLSRDQRGASAVEFSLVATPLFALILFVIQIGLYHVAKMSLDTGVIKESEALQAQFNAQTIPQTPTGAALKANIASYSGSIANGSALAVEIQPLTNLRSAPVAITDGLTNYGVAKTVLAIRASFTAASFVPGMSKSLVVFSSALVRRQNQ